MPRGKKELAEQIIPKLREVEVEVGRGKAAVRLPQIGDKGIVKDGIGWRLGRAVVGEKQLEILACLTGKRLQTVERVPPIPKHRHDNAEPYRGYRRSFPT